MTSYRYLGYGTTDANGVAHLTKNASGQDVNGYVGTGAGEVDVIASLDNPISQGSIVSGTLNVLDCVGYYNGTLNETEYNNEFFSATERSVTVDSTGTTLTIDSTKYSSTYSQVYFKDGASVLGYVSAPLCIEVKVLDVTNVGVSFPIKLKNGSTLWWAKTGVGNYKIVVTETKAEFYLNDVLQWYTTEGQEPISATTYLQSTRANGDGLIKFKDYKIYPI